MIVILYSLNNTSWDFRHLICEDGQRKQANLIELQASSILKLVQTR